MPRSKSTKFKKLDALVARCDEEIEEGRVGVSKIRFLQMIENVRQDEINTLTSNLQNIERLEPKFIKTYVKEVYYDHYLDKKQEIDDLIYDFKSGVVDPCCRAARFRV